MNKKCLYLVILGIFIFSCTKQVDKVNFTKQQYELDINKYIEHSISSNQIDIYTINVKEQLFFSIEIEQKEIDIKIALDTIDNNLLTIDNIKAKEGKEFLSYILNSGTYKVRISSPIKKQTKGNYKLIAKLRVPNETDIKSFAIQQSMIEAENLRNSGEEILIEKAATIYSESLEFYKLVNNKEKQMEILNIMGLIQFEKDNKEKSLGYYRDALKIAETSQDFYWIGKIFNAIGDIYFVERDMEVARFYFERGLEKRRRCGDINGEAESINNIGSVEWYIGENQKALDEYNKALFLLELTEDNVLKGIVNHNIGSIYDQLGEHEKALYYYELGLKLQTGIPFGEGHALIMLARAYNSLGNTKESLKHYGRALDIANKLNNDLMRATIFQHMAAILVTSDYKKAEAYYITSINLSKKAGDITAESISQAGIAKIKRTLGNYDLALERYYIALELIRKSKDIEVELSILYEIATTHYKMGDLKKAETTIKKVIETTETNRVKFDTPDLKSAYFGTKNDYYSLYISLLMNQFKNTNNIKYAENALEVNEKWHARSLLDVLAESKVENNNVDKNLLLKKDALQKLLNLKVEKEVKLINSNYSERELIKCKNEITKLKDELIGIESAIRKNNSKFHNFQYPKPLGIKEIKSLIDDNTLVLSYHIGKEDAYVWGITTKSTKAVSLGSSQQIISLARKIHFALSARAMWLDFEDEETHAQRVTQSDLEQPHLLGELSKIVLLPVSDLMEKYRKIVLITDSSLNYVPFAALNNPLDKSGNYIPLILSHQVVVIPSASTISIMRQQENKNEKESDRPISVAVFADPIFTRADPRTIKQPETEGISEDIIANNDLERAVKKAQITRGAELARLKWTRDEALAIKNVVSKCEVLLDHKASLEELYNLTTNSFDVLHIASHGIFNLVHPELSGVILSLVDQNGRRKPGFLNAKSILNLNAPKIVVLSACSTALGKDVPGEGTMGLAQAFMYVGAKKVVVTLWNVNDQATAKLMAEFYKNLTVNKKTLAESLRLAQIHILQNQEYKNPYYWASFIVQGEFD